MGATPGADAIATDDAGHEGAVAIVVVGVGCGRLVVVGQDATLEVGKRRDAAIHYRHRDPLPLQIARQLVGAHHPRKGTGHTAAGCGRHLEIGPELGGIVAAVGRGGREAVAGVEADGRHVAAEVAAGVGGQAAEEGLAFAVATAVSSGFEELDARIGKRALVGGAAHIPGDGQRAVSTATPR